MKCANVTNILYIYIYNLKIYEQVLKTEVSVINNKFI